MWNIKSFNFSQAVSTPSQSKLAQVSRGNYIRVRPTWLKKFIFDNEENFSE
jgi:hypothetical protein